MAYCFPFGVNCDLFCLGYNWFCLVLLKWVATIVAVLLVVTMTREIRLNCAKEAILKN